MSKFWARLSVQITDPWVFFLFLCFMAAVIGGTTVFLKLVF